MQDLDERQNTLDQMDYLLAVMEDLIQEQHQAGADQNAIDAEYAETRKQYNALRAQLVG